METIIITSDFSDPARNAAQYGASLAKELGVRTIVLYHAYDLAPIGTHMSVPKPDSSAALERCREDLQQLKDHIFPYTDNDIHIELEANELPLLVGIEQLARQWQAGMVIAGNAGKSGMEKFLMGSNTADLTKSCTIPLLIVPQDAIFQPITKIVFACDLKNAAESTPLDKLRFLIHHLQARLLVLNVEHKGKPVDRNTIAEQHVLDGLLAPLSPEYHYIEENNVSQGIMAFAEEEDAELVIAVPKSLRFFEKLFHRSVTKNLAQHSKIPLMILRKNELKV